MKAIIYTQYGPPEVLQMADIPKQTPRQNEVLVKIRATTVTIGDTIMRSLNIPVPGWQKVMARLYLGWNKPKRPILGMELAGEVESVGEKVTRFKPGDAVFASTFALNFGGYTEYKCLPENGVLSIKSLGAGQTIDYTCQDFAQSGAIYDVVFDAVGKLSPAQGKKALKPGGVYLNVHVDSDGGNTLANLLALKEIIEAGHFKPIIDRVYALEQIVEAHRYVEQGHKKGNVAIKVTDGQMGNTFPVQQGGK